jgi:hypothetical protein
LRDHLGERAGHGRAHRAANREVQRHERALGFDTCGGLHENRFVDIGLPEFPVVFDTTARSGDRDVLPLERGHESLPQFPLCGVVLHRPSQRHLTAVRYEVHRTRVPGSPPCRVIAKLQPLTWRVIVRLSSPSALTDLGVVRVDLHRLRRCDDDV